jgi:hypothetical protein
MDHASGCHECDAQRQELERARQLFVNVRLAHGSGSGTRKLERKISDLEVFLFRHRCAETA